MSNWLDDYNGVNETENEIISLLEPLIINFPNEKNTIEQLISSLKKESLSDELLVEIREKLKRIITKDEHNLIRKKDNISSVIKAISTYKTASENDGLYDFEDCFF